MRIQCPNIKIHIQKINAVELVGAMVGVHDLEVVGALQAERIAINRIDRDIAIGVMPKLASIRPSRKCVYPPSSSKDSCVVIPNMFHLVPRRRRSTMSLTASIKQAQQNSAGIRIARTKMMLVAKYPL